MRTAALLAAALFSACATNKPPRDPAHVTLALWTPPEGCAFVAGSSLERVTEKTSAVMIKDADDLRKIVGCTDDKRDAFAFDDEWLATFTFVSQGGSFEPLGLRDDGETLTLDVESRRYCGGTRPPTKVARIVYRVPAERRALATNVRPDQPPCPPGVP
jgi:hypothetical protein